MKRFSVGILPFVFLIILIPIVFLNGCGNSKSKSLSLRENFQTTIKNQITQQSKLFSVKISRLFYRATSQIQTNSTEPIYVKIEGFSKDDIVTNDTLMIKNDIKKKYELPRLKNGILEITKYSFSLLPIGHELKETPITINMVVKKGFVPANLLFILSGSLIITIFIWHLFKYDLLVHIYINKNKISKVYKYIKPISFLLVGIMIIDEIGLLLMEWGYYFQPFLIFRGLIGKPVAAIMIQVAELGILIPSAYEIQSEFINSLRNNNLKTFEKWETFELFRHIKSANSAGFLLSISITLFLLQTFVWGYMGKAIWDDIPQTAEIFIIGISLFTIILPLIFIFKYEEINKQNDQRNNPYRYNKKYRTNSFFQIAIIMFLTLTQTMITKAIVILSVLNFIRSFLIKKISPYIHFNTKKQSIYTLNNFWRKTKVNYNLHRWNILFFTMSFFPFLLLWQATASPLPPSMNVFPYSITISLFYTIFIILFVIVMQPGKMYIFRSALWYLVAILILYCLPLIQHNWFFPLGKAEVDLSIMQIHQGLSAPVLWISIGIFGFHFAATLGLFVELISEELMDDISKYPSDKSLIFKYYAGKIGVPLLIFLFLYSLPIIILLLSPITRLVGIWGLFDTVIVSVVILLSLFWALMSYQTLKKETYNLFEYVKSNVREIKPSELWIAQFQDFSLHLNKSIVFSAFIIIGFLWFSSIGRIPFKIWQNNIQMKWATPFNMNSKIDIHSLLKNKNKNYLLKFMSVKKDIAAQFVNEIVFYNKKNGHIDSVYNKKKGIIDTRIYSNGVFGRLNTNYFFVLDGYSCRTYNSSTLELLNNIIFDENTDIQSCVIDSTHKILYVKKAEKLVGYNLFNGDIVYNSNLIKKISTLQVSSGLYGITQKNNLVYLDGNGIVQTLTALPFSVNWLSNNKKDVILASSNYYYIFNSKSGQLLTLPISIDKVITRLLRVRNTMVISTADSTLLGLNLITNKLEWRHAGLTYALNKQEQHKPVNFPIRRYGDKILAVDRDQNLYALNSLSGDTLFNLKNNDDDERFFSLHKDTLTVSGLETISIYSLKNFEVIKSFKFIYGVIDYFKNEFPNFESITAANSNTIEDFPVFYGANLYGVYKYTVK